VVILEEEEDGVVEAARGESHVVEPSPALTLLATVFLRPRCGAGGCPTRPGREP